MDFLQRIHHAILSPSQRFVVHRDTLACQMDCWAQQYCHTFHLGVLSQASTFHFTTITSTPSAASSTPEWTSSSSVSVTATGLLIATTSSSQPESPTIVPTPSAMNASSARGMTTGSKIGIGAGVIGGVAVIGFLIYFLTFLLRSRRQEKYNRERVAQIQAKVRGTFSSDDTVNGNFDRLSSRGGAAHFNISRTATPNSLRDSALRPLPSLPLQYDSSRQEPYAPYQQLSESFTHELWHLNPEAIAQHTQLPSHYSFSGPPVTEPVSPAEAPPRRMGTVQEYAAALPSHYSFSGTNATSPISPIEAPLPTSVSPIPTVAQLSFSGPPLTIHLSPAENLNEQPPPPRMTPIQEYAAAQLPSHYSFQAPPSVTSPVSPIEDPTRRPIGIQEMAAVQLPSHYSFSASPSG
ncbi:hypothetical protein NA56DRAFT_655728 [Hyaloscypha hepaticicola]|uniref:Mid2 domain-containing protein n=1 Tax=Hyaloscypha hepaticicola TaxID=2082293 RepID=A0A2J6QH29_9HELO|nr:hypothetical protein NA56DRAFT_655728 [Hyaloscypha hepaticicola]